MLNNTGGTFKDKPTINTTYYLYNSTPAITFDARNGDVITPVEIGESMTLPTADPTWGDNEAKNNYKFEGWYTGIDGTGDKVTTNGAGGTKKLDSTNFTASTKVYAKWTKTTNIVTHTVRTTALDLSSADGTTTFEGLTPDANKIYTNANEGWQYNAETKTLILNNCTINTTETALNIGVSNATIILADGTESSIISTSGTENSYGINCYFGGLTIKGKGTINAVSGTSASNYSSTGIMYANGSLTIKDCIVNAVSHSAGNKSYGISSSNNSLILENCELTASGNTQAIAASTITATGATIKTSTTTSAGTGDYDAAKLSTYKWLSVSFAPTISISTQPAATTTVTKGEITGSLSVTAATANANGAAVTYQWYASNSNGATAISGETNASFTIPTTLPKGTYYYYCVLKATGCDDVITSIATVTVKNPVGTISGTVTKGGAAVDNATVKLMKGNTQVGSDATTDSNGAYSFSNVEYGVYSIEVTKTIDSKEKTVTIPVTLSSATATGKDVSILNATGNQNTVVETKVNTPPTTTDLNPLFNAAAVTDNDKGITATDKTTISNGGTVEIKLTAEAKTAGNVAGDATLIKNLSKDDDANYLFVDLTVTKSVTPSGGTKVDTTLKELNELIEVTMEIPAEYQKNTLRIFRIHEGVAEELKKTANDFGEYYDLNADYSIATLHIKRFSTFAMSIDAVTPAPTSGGGSGAYPVAVPTVKNGKLSVSPASASTGATVTVTVTPDKGYMLDTLSVTDANGKAIAATKNSNGTYSFIMPDGKVTVTATFKTDSANPFADVSASAYYYDAVLWAAKNEIASGTDATHFNPDGVCTRAQAVTFLWRAYGSPEPTSTANPFTDVKADAYYYKAVLWAIEKGVTAGTTTTTFSPDATVTRAQAVSFLWRSAGSPAQTAANPFADVAGDAYYASAVLWAVKEGVTAGTTTTTFSPSEGCTRAQIVSFLYRYFVK